MLEITEAPEKTHNEELLDVIYMLYDYKRRGVDARYNFNGTMIFASEINGPTSIDVMFKKVYGCTYIEYAQARAEKMCPEWLETGYKIIPEKRHNDWKDYVESFVKTAGSYQVGNPVITLLKYIDIINALDEKTEEDVIVTIIDALDAISPALVNRLAYFSNKEDLIRKLYDEKVGKLE